MLNRLLSYLVFWGIFVFFNQAFAQNLILNDLIEEALKNNREIIASQDRVEVAKNRIPQASSLPDPMLMAGYQNEGLRRYTYGEAENAQWMFTASQMFPFWGKRGLKSEMAARDAQSLSEMQKVIQLKTISRVSEIYFDLFQTYKNIDLIRDRGALFSKIEDIAASRYATGMSSQQEVLMAQTEKYTLLEREEMLKQKILSLEAMLLSALGRASSESLGRPAERPVTKFIPSLNDVLKQGESHSPEIKSRQRMMEAAEAKLKMTRKEYFPDVTMNASVFPRGGEFENMYSLTASFNINLLQVEAEAGRSGSQCGAESGETRTRSDKIHDFCRHPRQLLHGPIRREANGTLSKRPDSEDIPGFRACRFRLRDRKGGCDRRNYPAEESARFRNALLDTVRGERKGDCEDEGYNWWRVTSDG